VTNFKSGRRLQIFLMNSTNWSDRQAGKHEKVTEKVTYAKTLWVLSYRPGWPSACLIDRRSHVKRLLIGLMVVFGGVTALGQEPKETVWVLQNPPFGGIASLAGFPELPSAFPMGGPLQVDVRLSERIVGVQGGFPSRFLRLTQTGNEVDGSLYLWWFGQIGPYEPPASLPRRCTQPREGPGVCVVALPPVRHDWRSVLRDVLTADACPAASTTHASRVPVQVFERMPYPRYRAADLCEPIATRLRTLLNALAPNDFRQRK
jgi:hypothetical protein